MPKSSFQIVKFSRTLFVQACSDNDCANEIDVPNFVEQHFERNKAILAASMLNTHSEIPSQLFVERDNLHNYLVITHSIVDNNTNDDNLLSQTVTTINRVVVDDRYKPYCCTGIVFHDKGVENEIVILRDTDVNLYLIDQQYLEDIETRFFFLQEKISCFMA